MFKIAAAERRGTRNQLKQPHLIVRRQKKTKNFTQTHKKYKLKKFYKWSVLPSTLHLMNTNSVATNRCSTYLAPSLDSSVVVSGAAAALVLPFWSAPSCSEASSGGVFCRSDLSGQSAMRWSSLLQLWHRFGWGPIVHFAAMWLANSPQL